MSSLHQTRCINHAGREAAARCPVCKNYFCRECITEHEGRVICAACLQKTAPQMEKKNSGIFKGTTHLFGGITKAAAGLFLLWFLFYAVGRFLLIIPDSFHTGELWKGL